MSRTAEQPQKRDLGEWSQPPNEFGVAPFWFWNDDLDEAKLIAQLDDFLAHGVGGFVLHPRVGLPRTCGFMSDAMLSMMKRVVDAAAERDMQVILYDEGMYPSGSGSGLVVAENASYRTRGMVAIDLDEAKPGERCNGVLIDAKGEPALEDGQVLITVQKRSRDGHRIAVVNRFIDSTVRGIHLKDHDGPKRDDGQDPPEDAPQAADLLNPEAVACFIRVVYHRMYDALGEHFGKTVTSIFTDEPNPLSKCRERGVMPGTVGSVERASAHLGYDIGAHLLALWFDDEPNAAKHRADWKRAIKHELGETFLRPIQQWCREHNVALTGHPSAPDDIGLLKYFDIPGQDVVWRYAEPDKPSAIEGEQSTQCKCASSAMLHYGRRRNLNEYAGAYGHDLTRDEFDWLMRWAAVRGCNLFVPHAFYYSTRGPRGDERPPDVGPNSPWWDTFKMHADEARRLAWLNTIGKYDCPVAILGRSDWLPWEAAKVCFENQFEFDYIDAADMVNMKVGSVGIETDYSTYQFLIVQGDSPRELTDAIKLLQADNRVIHWDVSEGEAVLRERLRTVLNCFVPIEPVCPGLRFRSVRTDHGYWAILFNETKQPIEFRMRLSELLELEMTLIDPATDERVNCDVDQAIHLDGHALRVLFIPFDTR